MTAPGQEALEELCRETAEETDPERFETLWWKAERLYRNTFPEDKSLHVQLPRQEWALPFLEALLTNPSFPISALLPPGGGIMGGNAFQWILPRHSALLAENPSLFFLHTQGDSTYLEFVHEHFARGDALNVGETAATGMVTLLLEEWTQKREGGVTGPHLAHLILRGLRQYFQAFYPMLEPPPEMEIKKNGSVKITALASWRAALSHWRSRLRDSISLISQGHVIDLTKAIAVSLDTISHQPELMYFSVGQHLMEISYAIARTRAPLERVRAVLLTETLPQYLAWVRIMADLTEQPMPKHVLWRVMDEPL